MAPQVINDNQETKEPLTIYNDEKRWPSDIDHSKYKYVIWATEEHLRKWREKDSRVMVFEGSVKWGKSNEKGVIKRGNLKKPNQ